MNVQSEGRTKKLWQGAFILSIAGLLTKILSAGYRIPYQNIAGDIGFYIYQQVYPIYGTALIFSTYGFPVIISKLLAEKENDSGAAAKIVYTSFFTLVGIGLLFFGCLYWGADNFALLMGDQNLAILIRVISFSFLLLPFISVFRGFFQGQKNMLPTAVSQVAEQLIRVFTILTMTILLLEYGYGSYEAGAGAIFGSITGGIVAIIVLLFFWLKGNYKLNLHKTQQTTLRSREIIRTIIGQGITICISALLLILFQLVDSFTIYTSLVSEGMDEVLAKQLKGIYDRSQPLIQLGTIIATSLSLAIVPLIAEAKSRKDHAFIKDKIGLSLRLSIVIGVGASVGLACILEPTNIMLYENNLGTNVLIIMGCSIFFTSLIQTITAILQGLGHPYLPVLSIGAGILLKWLLNLLLVPSFHTVGAAIATVLAFCIILVIHLLMLNKKFPGLFTGCQFVIQIVKGAVFMLLFIVLYLFVLEAIFGENQTSRIFASFQSLTSVIVGGCIYVFFIIRGRVFLDEEISFIPVGSKGEKIFRFLLKRR